MARQTDETALGRVVVAWLKDWGWDVYQEVQVAPYGPVADIVATRGPLVQVVECKTAMSLRLLDQALGWGGLAHYVSLATPAWALGRMRHNRNGGQAVEAVLREAGLGWLGVRMGDGFDGYAKPQVEELFAPRLNRRASVEAWRRVLTDRHKDYAAAGSMGRHLTTFRAGCEQVARWVAAHPGCSVKALVDGLGRLHYETPATARSCWAKWLQAGVVPGVRCERTGRALALYPDRSAVPATQVSP